MKLNRVELSGNVGSIDIFESEGKRPFARVSLAENNQYTNKNGEKVEKTTWHKLVFYGKVVSIVKDKVSKGSQLIVIGRLDYQNWETDDGQKRQTAFVVVDQFDVKNKEKPVDVNHDDPEVPFFDDMPF